MIVRVTYTNDDRPYGGIEHTDFEGCNSFDVTDTWVKIYTDVFRQDMVAAMNATSVRAVEIYDPDEVEHVTEQ